MSIGDALKIAFFVILILALALAIMNYIQQANQPKPQLAMGTPAGLYYKGPPTTALAAWYCIENINSTNYYSIQLNAELNNGLEIQNTYGPSVTFDYITWQTAFLDNVWYEETSNGTPVLLHASNPINDVVNAPCAWLVIALKNGIAYFGYSLDGRHVVWYDSYTVGNTTIEPAFGTQIVLAGASNGEQAQLGHGTLVFLALYYWNGTNWVPAKVGVMDIYAGTVESVNHAWIYTRGECSGYVAWFGWNKTDWTTPVLPGNIEPICPTPPSFRP